MLLHWKMAERCHENAGWLAGCLLGAQIPRLGRLAGPLSQQIHLWISTQGLQMEKCVSPEEYGGGVGVGAVTG